MPSKNLLSAIDLSKVVIQPLRDRVLTEKHITVNVLRLDTIHPVISGNKWFKLKYYLQEAVQLQKQVIVTFGGAYSNHIVATACAATLSGLKSIGIIRGERPAGLSDTLQDAARLGMQLEFISRDKYKKKNETNFFEKINFADKNYFVIPDGGAGLPGIKGAADIMQVAGKNNYSHIVCAVGTAATLAGLINASDGKQQVIGIAVLKNLTNVLEQYGNMIDTAKKLHSTIIDNYHFGGYAKKTKVLTDFMNGFYLQHQIPTDFVYTGKLMYALTDLIQKNFFSPSDNILVIHSGGLQGNRSLPVGVINF